MKYRKRPLVVEAVQLNYQPGQPLSEKQLAALPVWFHEALNKWWLTEGRIFHHSNGLLVIVTLEGLVEISPGDYVIQGTKGEIYPCKPDIFAMIYEPA